MTAGATETLRYVYRPKRLPFALAGLFSAGCATLFAKMALQNDRGLIVDRIFRFSSGEATAVYWALASACMLGVLIALLGVARSFGATREVVLDGTTIVAPKNALAATVVSLPLTDITALRMTQVRSEHFLVIQHVDGKLTISGSMLPMPGDLEELASALGERVLALRGGGTTRKRGIGALR